MARESIPTWCFALVVVQRGDQFLLVHERKHGQLWYLPAGRVEPGETFAAAACRETLEETGVPVRLLGILRVEHTPGPTSARLRVIFLGRPLDDAHPKTVPDNESLGAAWVTLAQLKDYQLRSEEVGELFEYVAGGGTIYPTTLLQLEGAPFPPRHRDQT